MNAKDAAVEVALLGIAKDLLQASDDLAATDPSASAKLAHEAYEIGRDLGIVRNHLDPSSTPPATAPAVAMQAAGTASSYAEETSISRRDVQPMSGAQNGAPRKRQVEEEGDDDLFRILDRQRAVVPSFAEVVPARKPSRNDKQLTFEVKAPKRSGWFSWMKSRDLHHAG
ncbi:MAG: hypothetical protein ACRBM6_15695 [Geminicoccales bacterium]